MKVMSFRCHCVHLLGLLALLLSMIAVPLAPLDANAQTTSDDGLPGSTSDCTLVELYPGYPGYRGNITGVMSHWGGTGDYVCLQELEAVDRRFGREDEDRANERVARSLGINGTFQDWTWENWMLIEAERGLPSSCYTCLMFNTSESPYNPDVLPERDDPRLFIGFPFTRVAIDQITQELFGQASPSSAFYSDDYMFRAEAYFQLGTTANAPEILAEMTDKLYAASQPGVEYYSYQNAIDVILERGGYTWVTGDMSPDDQIFVAVYALWVGIKFVDPLIRESYINNFMAVVSDWQFTGYRGSFREYLDENWNP